MTENSHSSVDAREPDENVSMDVPLIVDPEPQISLAVADDISNPVSADSKSIVNSMFAASAVEFSLCISLKLAVTVPPGATESPTKSILKLGADTTLNTS